MQYYYFQHHFLKFEFNKWNKCLTQDPGAYKGLNFNVNFYETSFENVIKLDKGSFKNVSKISFNKTQILNIHVHTTQEL